MDSFNPRKFIKTYSKSKNACTLIILDWDDSLFPTSWSTRNNINLIDSQNRWRYVPIFKELDNTLYNFLRKLKKYGKVIIITNAMTSWVYDSVSVLPKTSRIIKSIDIMSARQLYQTEFNDMMEWKKHTFKQAAKQIIDESVFAGYRHSLFANGTAFAGSRCSLPANGKVVNIVSIGDAEYEYNALVDLDKWLPKNKKILKSIKLLSNPTQNIIIDQLTVLNNAIPDICTINSHLDWNFKRN